MIDRDEQVTSDSPPAAAALKDRDEGGGSADDDVTVSTTAVPCNEEETSPFDEGVRVKVPLVAATSTSRTAHDGDGGDDEHDDDAECDAAEDGEYEHGFEPGDHVLRWTHLAYLYPIQVHGIVLSAGPGIVTLVDFGRSGSAPRCTYGPPSDEKGETIEEEAAMAADEASGGKGGGKDKQQTPRRLVVMTLTEEAEIRQWRKVEYGENLLSGGRLKRFLVSLLSGGSKKKDGAGASGKDATGNGDSDASVAEIETMSEEELLRKIDEGCLQDLSAASRAAAAGGRMTAPSSGGGTAPAGDSDGNDNASKEQQSKTATLPSADPAKIVLARVRYLLEHERPGNRPNDSGTANDKGADDGKTTTSSDSSSSSSVLPPYHIFFANSECTAVWCKTGTFSTLQASVFLHSTAIGNAKSAATLALLVSSQTVPVTVTVPAAGIMGWFGATTTTTSMVPLLSTQPWLLPAMAGYGIAAVGGPYVVLAAARERWRAATQKLNDGFWTWADGEVYAEAIRQWNGEGLFRDGSSGGAAVDTTAAVVVR